MNKYRYEHFVGSIYDTNWMLNMNENQAEKILNEFLRGPYLENPISMAVSNYRMSTLGKLVFASIITTMVTGQRSPFKLSGDPRKIEILSRAVQSSKRFQDEIKRPGASVDSVMRALDAKNLDANNFRSVFGVPWPL